MQAYCFQSRSSSCCCCCFLNKVIFPPTERIANKAGLALLSTKQVEAGTFRDFLELFGVPKLSQQYKRQRSRDSHCFLNLKALRPSCHAFCWLLHRIPGDGPSTTQQAGTEGLEHSLRGNLASDQQLVHFGDIIAPLNSKLRSFTQHSSINHHYHEAYAGTRHPSRILPSVSLLVLFKT